MRAVRLVADVGPVAASAEVRVEYTVAREDTTAGPIRLEALGFGPATVDAVRLGGDTIPLAPEAGSMRAGILMLPDGPPGVDEVAFTLVYRVAEAVERSGPEVRVRVPVPVLDLPPEQGGGPVFHAAVHLPAGWSVSGGFPAGPAPTAEGSWEVDLPVVPAMVSLRGRSDGAWRPGLPETLDAAGLIVLLGFVLVGWRHLRQVAARGREAAA